MSCKCEFPSLPQLQCFISKEFLLPRGTGKTCEQGTFPDKSHQRHLLVNTVHSWSEPGMLPRITYYEERGFTTGPWFKSWFLGLLDVLVYLNKLLNLPEFSVYRFVKWRQWNFTLEDCCREDASKVPCDGHLISRNSKFSNQWPTLLFPMEKRGHLCARWSYFLFQKVRILNIKSFSDMEEKETKISEVKIAPPNVGSIY